MTFIAKLLVFVNLIVGVGFAVKATVVYTERPQWFEPAPDVIEKGQAPLTFKMLSDAIDVNAKTAGAESRAWGAEWRKVQAVEALRDARRAKYVALLTAARNGDKATGAAFYNLPEDSTTRLLDLDNRKDVVRGPDGLPLQGSDTLQSRVEAAGVKIVEFGAKSKDLREQQKKLTAEIGVTETRVLKQLDIRENLRTEGIYLASFEINITEQRDTTQRRRGQIIDRLRTFGVSPGSKK